MHLSNGFLSPFITLASTASSGNELHNLIMHCVKKDFVLLALDPLPWSSECSFIYIYIYTYTYIYIYIYSTSNNK